MGEYKLMYVFLRPSFLWRRFGVLDFRAVWSCKLSIRQVRLTAESSPWPYVW